MATRFAGDFFGIPLTTPGEDNSSSLFSYFPDLKTIRRGGMSSERPAELGPARSYGGAQAVTPFTGFKTFEVSNEKKAAPLFAGFKTFEQPTRSSSVSTRSSEKDSSAFATSPTQGTTQINPEVLKSLGLA